MQNKSFILLTFLLIYTNLFSSDIVTQYRLHGIDNIQQQLDKELSNQEYWKRQLEHIDTKFGYIESYSNLLICDKSKSTLTLYRQDSNNTYQLKKNYNAFTGKVQGDKLKEGDLITPIGIYNLTEKISKLDSFYGPMAFVTSYPNVYDKYKGKNGSGIWIHGLPSEQDRDEFTKGCIAIDNKSIECLDRNIDISKTLLIINADHIKQNISKETLSTLLADLFAWRYSWIYNDIEEYLKFYDSEFIRFDGMDFERFENYKRRIFSKNEDKTIVFTEINVLPYPNTENVFKISFNEAYNAQSFSFSGNKVLIVKLINNKMQIITEK